MSTSMSTSTSTSTSDNNVDFIHKCAEILQPYCITAFTKANHNPLLELAYDCGAAYNASGSPYSEAVVQKYADVLHYAISSWLTRYPSMAICKELQELLEERTTRYCHFKISTKLFQQFERELFILSPDHYVDDFEFLINFSLKVLDCFFISSSKNIDVFNCCSFILLNSLFISFIFCF